MQQLNLIYLNLIYFFSLSLWQLECFISSPLIFLLISWLFSVFRSSLPFIIVPNSTHLSSPLQLSSLIVPSLPSSCLLFACPSFLFFSSPFYSLHYFHVDIPFRLFFSSPLLSHLTPHYLFFRAFLPSTFTSSYNALLLQYEYESLNALRIYDNCYFYSLHFGVFPSLTGCFKVFAT